MRPGQQLIGLLWRWHRRTGVAICLFVLVLAATGVLLNHSTGLGLDGRFVHWQWLTRHYGDDSGDLRAFPVDGRWLSRAIDGRLYLDSAEVATCHGELVGVALVEPLLLAACEEELVLLTRSGELVESLTASTGLPVPLAGLGLFEGAVALRSSGQWVLADLDSLTFEQRPPAGSMIPQLTAGKLPADIQQNIPAPARWLTWERVLLDLHSGRILGGAGVWLVDGVGVLLICIAFSGVTMWWFHRRRRQRVQRES